MKNFFKKIILSTLLIGISVTISSAQNTELAQADSLFAKKKYTEAFDNYQSIFNTGNVSPAMLIKMAFIKEGLGNYVDALYYLNLYYQETSDKAALKKMREIAEEHSLTGYEYSDFKFFLNFIQRYINEIVFSLMAIGIFLLAYVFVQRRKKERPVTSVVLQVLVLLLVGILINGYIFQQNAIIASDNALLMSGPSAASEPVESIEKGHQVELLKEGEVWNLILWNEKPVYIRRKNLKVL